MEDPPNVEQVEMLRLIDELEHLYTDLLDVNAGVSSDSIERLRKLRVEVLHARSPSRRQQAWEIAVAFLRAAAPEVIKILIETLTCKLAAFSARRRIYEVRRIHQIPTRSQWAHAT